MLLYRGLQGWNKASFNQPLFYYTQGYKVSVYDQISAAILETADVIIMQRQGSENVFKVMQQVKEKRPETIFIYDIDDYFHGLTASNPATPIVHHPKSTMLTYIEKFLSFVDVVTVSTKELADKYSQFNSNMVIMPNGINTDLYKYTNTLRPKRGINIGWHGSRTHYSDLEIAAPALKQVLNRNPEARLFFFGYIPINLFLDVSTDRFSYFPETDVFSFPYTLASLGINIAVAPIAPTAFNACKSNVKWLEFSALRVPVVASNFGPYGNSIVHGKDGFLAATEAEWVDSLERLLKDEELRKSIGTTAYDRVKKDFTTSMTADGIKAAIELAKANKSRTIATSMK